MARIENSAVKETSGAYHRLFGISALGQFLSRVHSTVISAGTELERIILDQVDQIDDLDKFLSLEIMPEGVLIATKQQIKKSKSLESSNAEPDFLIFKRRNNQQGCHVVELKDGHQFDTKKASAEHQAIHSFMERNGCRMQYQVSAHFCCFNQNSREAIVTGFKRKISRNEAMTGREFCALLEINYDEITEVRKQEQPMNVLYFLRELIKIDQARDILQDLLRNGNG